MFDRLRQKIFFRLGSYHFGKLLSGRIVGTVAELTHAKDKALVELFKGGMPLSPGLIESAEQAYSSASLYSFQHRLVEVERHPCRDGSGASVRRELEDIREQFNAAKVYGLNCVEAIKARDHMEQVFKRVRSTPHHRYARPEGPIHGRQPMRPGP